MLAKLFSKTGALAGSEYLIEQEAIVGRDAGCDITLFLHTVSNRHARIYLGEDGQSFFLEDLDSSNGTYLDNHEVTRPRRLGPLHVITFAKNVDMIFQVFPDRASANMRKSSGASASSKGRTQMQDAFVMPEDGLPGMPARSARTQKQASEKPAVPKAPQTTSGVKSAPGNAAPSGPPGSRTTYGEGFAALPDIPGHDDTVLKDASGNLIGSDTPANVVQRFAIVINNVHESDRDVALPDGKSVIGRGEVCDIRVKDEYLSGRHALLRVSGGSVYLSDLGSTNGTFIGDEKLEAEVEIKPGAEFRLGPTTKVMLKMV